MADGSLVSKIKNDIDSILSYREKNLTNRGYWHPLHFEAAASDLDRLYNTMSHLKLLPIQYVPVHDGNDIHKFASEVATQLNAIDAFDIKVSNAPQRRDNIIKQLNVSTDRLISAAVPWILFLMHQHEGVTESVEALVQSVTVANGHIASANSELESAKQKIENDRVELFEQSKIEMRQKVDEADEILTQAREMVAEKGATVFTKEFSEESEHQTQSAQKWLAATATFGTVSLLTALAMWYFAEPVSDITQLIQTFGSKMAILVVLFTATIWCGRIYRALMHQSTVNKHRALGLQTFQAFSRAASDAQTKDAVLLETTRTIFSTGSTGYLESNAGGSDKDVRVVEMVRSPVASATEVVSKN